MKPRDRLVERGKVGCTIPESDKTKAEKGAWYIVEKEGEKEWKGCQERRQRQHTRRCWSKRRGVDEVLPAKMIPDLA
jgi:hypothetical protein